MSRGDIIGGAAVPLVDALPWTSFCCSGTGSSRTYLVNDSIGSDGRFLLYTLASRVLSGSTSNNTTTANASTKTNTRSSRGRILWLSCGPVTENHILQGLKKIGCDKTVLQSTNSSSNQASSDRPLTILNLMEEISIKIKKDKSSLNEQQFLKGIYHSVEEWIQHNNTSSNNKGVDNASWIILDDVSALASILGERLVYSFIVTLNAKSRQQNNNFGLMIRCSNDHEPESLPTFSGSSTSSSSSGTEWFGAGGKSLVSDSHGHYQEQYEAVPAWERSLVELADGIMDVLPLTSGYTRELHGRIVLTEMPQGNGWSDEKRHWSRNNQANPSMQTLNFCITDQKIIAYKI